MSRTRARVAACCISLFLPLACSSRAEEGAVPPLRGDHVVYGLSLYYAPLPTADPEAALEGLLAKSFPDFRQRDPESKAAVSPEISYVAAHRLDFGSGEAPSLEEVSPPFAQGLTPQRSEALTRSKQALLLCFDLTRKRLRTDLQSAQKLAGALAGATGGMVFDVEAEQVFTPEGWETKRLAGWAESPPNVVKLIVVRVAEEPGGARVATRGMSSLGLPDLVVEKLPRSSVNQMANLLDWIAQAELEGAVPTASGDLDLRLTELRNPTLRRSIDLAANASGEAKLRLRPAKRQEGDPERLQEVVFDRYPGPDASARLEAFVASAYGSHEEPPKVSRHDAVVQEASARARRELPALRAAFAKGLPIGERILLKAGFPIPEGGTEWMWVEVSSWQGATIHGYLQNEPTRIPTLKVGQAVEVSEGQVADYLREHADGKEEGNLTRPALESGH